GGRRRPPPPVPLEQPQTGDAACHHLHPDPWASQVVKSPHPGRVIVADPQSQPRTAATVRDPNLGGTLKPDAKEDALSPLRVEQCEFRHTAGSDGQSSAPYAVVAV